MREADTSSVPYGRYEKDESIFGLSDLASLAAFIYLLFFLLVLVIYSANPFEPAVFGFYKLSVFFQVVSFFGIFFVPTLLIYFALDFTKSVGHTVVVLGYPILALGAAAILNIPDAPLFAALSGVVLFAFYFLAGLNRSAIERRQRAPYARSAVRQSPVVLPPPRLPPQRRPSDQRPPAQRRQMSQYAPPSRPSDFGREVRPQYGSSDGFLSRLDRFLDRYDYVDGEAVRKGSRRSGKYERDRRRGGR
ncbi:MAG: hypothetical protein ABSB81_00740 [Halobacteriota archaeon]|jgi:hypothetical protein